MIEYRLAGPMFYRCFLLSLIKYLITLVTPPGGICLDPFEGSGTHALACKDLGFNYIGFELDKTYYNIATKRINA
jgi:DNA modification methylase